MKLIRYVIILYLIIQISTIIVFSNDTSSEKLSSSENYIFVTKWGTKGREDGQFGHPTPGDAYWYKITDKTIENLKDKLDKNKLDILESLKDRDFDRDEFLRNINELKLDIKLLEYTVSDKLSDDEFYKNGPSYIATDSSGNIYVSDLYNHRIQKFDSKGNFITKWGKYGLGDEEFLRNESVAVDSKDNIYVLDFNFIKKFNSNGNFTKKWYISDDGGMGFPQNLAVGANDYIYSTVMVRYTIEGIETNIIKDNIQVFNSEGEFIKKWLFYNSIINLLCVDHPLSNIKPVPVYDKMVIDKENNIFVIDYKGKFFSKFTPDDEIFGVVQITDKVLRNLEKNKINTEKLKDLLYKEFRVQSLINELKERNIPGDQSKMILNYVERFLYLVSYLGEDILGKPVNITLDTKGNIFVVDKGNNCIVKFDNSGNFITKFGSFGSGDGQFNRPEAVTVDRQGNVYVMDTGNYRIQKFAPKLKED